MRSMKPFLFKICDNFKALKIIGLLNKPDLVHSNFYFNFIFTIKNEISP